MNKKRILMSLASVAGVLAGVAALGAYEAHVINVTAHIENALAVDTYGIDFGTVFPQEYLEEGFTVRLSDSFQAQDRLYDVEYDIVQKPKHWRDEFDDTYPEHRSLNWVDPDGDGSYRYDSDKLFIKTGEGVEDLFGPNEIAGDWTAPRKVMMMGGNFVAETHTYADPGPYYESAGLLAYGQDGDVVRLEVSNWDKWGMGYVVYMESQEGGVKTGKGWDQIPTYNPANGVYLRLSREGDTFKGEFSLDGSSWDEVTFREESDMDNNLAGKPALVGVAVTHSDEESGDPFEASFEYVDMNGKYQDFCRFLSKMKDIGEGTENDIEEPSYFYGYGEAEGCRDRDAEVPTPGGVLYDVNDIEDHWKVDLRVPPLAGYVGQDWPESCRQYWVVPQEDDYGCDLWIEVTGFSKHPEWECTGDGDCNDGNACTEDACDDGGVCQYDCRENEPCTYNSSVGVCSSCSGDRCSCGPDVSCSG